MLLLRPPAPPAFPDADEAVINPRRGKREEPVAPQLLMTFTRPDYLAACRLLAVQGRPRDIIDCPIREGVWHGQTLAVAGPAPGAPYAVMVLEKLIALGAQIIMALGWCGSLQPEAEIGTLIVPDSAWSEEGTSAHYPVADPEPRPGAGLRQLLQARLTALGTAFKSGKVWTTDAIYRETKGKVRAYGDWGILAVEMEMSALFTVARYRGVALAGLLVVSDEMFTLNWRHGLREERFRRSRGQAIRAALDVLAASAVSPLT